MTVIAVLGRWSPVRPPSKWCYQLSSFPQFFLRAASNSPHYPPSHHALPTKQKAIVFYRWPTIRHFRLLSRGKLYQVVLMALFLPPATISYQHGTLPGSTLTAAYVAASGTLAVLSLSYIFTRVIGQMAYFPDTHQVGVSTLTFLGDRRNILVDPRHILPLGGRGLVQRLEIVGHNGTFVYSIRYGQVLNAELMAQLIC